MVWIRLYYTTLGYPVVDKEFNSQEEAKAYALEEDYDISEWKFLKEGDLNESQRGCL